MMYAAINQWSFPAGMSIRESMERAKAQGFEGFEPAISQSGELSLTSADRDILNIRDMADGIGIRLASLASGLSWGASPTSNDPAVREKARAHLKRQLECAKLLNIDAVLWVPGTVGTGFWGGEGDVVDYEDAWNRTVENLHGMKGYAEELGVTIGVENVWNNFLMSPLEMRVLIDEIDSPRVRVYLDVGNVVKFGFPEMWIKALGNRISRVHVKDYKRDVGTLAGFVDLLCGDTDYVAVTDALKDVGYEGPLTAEMGAAGCYPADIVYRTARALEKILGRR